MGTIFRDDPKWEDPREPLASHIRQIMDANPGFRVVAKGSEERQYDPGEREWYAVAKAYPFRKHVFFFKEEDGNHVETWHVCPKAPPFCERCGAENPSVSVFAKTGSGPSRKMETTIGTIEYDEVLHVCRACYDPKKDQGCLMEWGWSDAPGASGCSGVKG
jgi:hypothetical protein